MDLVDELTEIADTGLYYSSDDEFVSKVLEEIKTDVRYAVAEKTQLDNISDDEIAVDMECFNEPPAQSNANDDNNPDAAPTRTDIVIGDISPEVKNSIHAVSDIGDKYMEFLAELEKNNSDIDKE